MKPGKHLKTGSWYVPVAEDPRILHWPNQHGTRWLSYPMSTLEFALSITNEDQA